MFKIIHLSIKGNDIQRNPTDYDPMDLEQALSIVTELTCDAIESQSLHDFWIIVPQDK